MSSTISVTPVSPVTTQPLTTVNVSADLAKTYADAVAEAKAEVLAAEAALRGETLKAEATLDGDIATAKAWLKSNWQHIVTWGLSGAAAFDKLLVILHAI